MERSRHRKGLATVAVALAAVGFLDGCGASQKIAPLKSTATCNDFVAASPKASPNAAATALVRSTVGASNLTWRAGATDNICSDYSTLGRGNEPVRTVIEETKTSCTQWLAEGADAQTALAHSIVGTTNLPFRIEGTTAACMDGMGKGQGDEPVAEILEGIAKDYSTPVNVDEAKLPPTLKPDDPHQCWERVGEVQVPTNAALIQAGDADCLAQGF